MKPQELINKVIERIIEDVNYQDYTAIEELLESLSEETLREYLSE